MQMNRLHDTATMLIYDPIGPNRIATRASLHSLGFRRVDLAASLDILRERLRLRSPDLLLVEVPNPLNIRARQNLGEDESDRQTPAAIKRAKETMSPQKTRRDAVQRCLQWRMLEQRVPGARDFREILPRLNRLAVGMKQRLGDAEAREHCTSVTRSVDNLIALADAAGRECSSID